jgi:hypothetical protein
LGNIEVNVYLISLMAMAQSPINLRVTTIILMEINLLARFLTALLYTRMEISLRASSKMAGGITAR